MERPESINRFKTSQTLLERALKVIPLGTQTFSKSTLHYPLGVSPHFIERGQGSQVWDVDGNSYIDYVNALCAVNLGYCDPDVDGAVREQVARGSIFSLAHPIEFQVAEKICEMVPCAEKVRFGKNGSDATSGAVRVARAYTGKDHVAVCGYHGWQDWYIGSTTRNKGVPKAVRDLTHSFSYNDVQSLHSVFDRLGDQVAAVILEPMNYTFPKPGFLEEVRELCTKKGAVLIFDETITGFRFSPGGAQEFFKVIPDLATFGKGLANGYPLSAVAGKSEIMKEMEEVFFSFTYGGEALSLAAALATMEKIQKNKVTEVMANRGEGLMSAIRSRINQFGVGDWLELSGHPTWFFLTFKDAKGVSLWETKTLFLQEMLQDGILMLASHNMSYSHSEQDIEKTLAAYDRVLPLIQQAISSQKMSDYLHCEVLKPLFKLR